MPLSPVTPTQGNSAPVTPGLCHPTTAPPQLPHTGVDEAQSAVLEGWRKNCGGLNPEHQEQLWQLLLEFQGSFAMSEEEVGRTHLVEHEIDTGDSRPIKCRPRRLPLSRQQACDEAVQSMLQADIIEPSNSTCSHGPKEDRWLAAVLRLQAGERSHQEGFIPPPPHR